MKCDACGRTVESCPCKIFNWNICALCEDDLNKAIEERKQIDNDKMEKEWDNE